jgi:hypothetical protein
MKITITKVELNQGAPQLIILTGDNGAVLTLDWDNEAVAAAVKVLIESYLVEFNVRYDMKV